METETEIYFYPGTGKFGYMSNFYKCEFKESGSNIIFNCSEQYYMYKKCLLFEPDNLDLQENILNETSPTNIKKLGRSVKNFDSDKWDKYKVKIMMKGIYLKFKQNKKIRDKLLETNNKLLYEASPTDRIWGIGFSISDIKDHNELEKNRLNFGSNLLGKCLMKIREII
jgi:hypothetical protein